LIILWLSINKLDLHQLDINELPLNKLVQKEWILALAICYFKVNFFQYLTKINNYINFNIGVNHNADLAIAFGKHLNYNILNHYLIVVEE